MTTTASPVRTGQASSNGSSRNDLRAPKGPRAERARRRVFGADYKLAILAEYDRCSEAGEKGALLRREGLYSSIITDWRRQHRQGSLVVTPGRSEGGRGGPSRSEVARLRAENERLRKKLAKAEAIIEVQGKVQALLEELSKSADCEESSTQSWTTE
jgi:transposase